VRYARGAVTSDARFVRYAAAAVVAFVAFGKVLSPQFLIWLLAIVVLVQGARGIAATTLLVAACALTRAWFPSDYWDLVKQFDPTASWLVLLRDVVLVAVFATLVARGSSRIRATELEEA
jgi:Na+/H+-dicarboxylate symporter